MSVAMQVFISDNELDNLNHTDFPNIIVDAT